MAMLSRTSTWHALLDREYGAGVSALFTSASARPDPWTAPRVRLQCSTRADAFFRHDSETRVMGGSRDQQRGGETEDPF